MNNTIPWSCLRTAIQAFSANQLANMNNNNLRTPSCCGPLPQEVRRRLCPHTVKVQLHNSQTWPRSEWRSECLYGKRVSVLSFCRQTSQKGSEKLVRLTSFLRDASGQGEHKGRVYHRFLHVYGFLGSMTIDFYIKARGLTPQFYLS